MPRKEMIMERIEARIEFLGDERLTHERLTKLVGATRQEEHLVILAGSKDGKVQLVAVRIPEGLCLLTEQEYPVAEPFGDEKTAAGELWILIKNLLVSPAFDQILKHLEALGFIPIYSLYACSSDITNGRLGATRFSGDN